MEPFEDRRVHHADTPTRRTSVSSRVVGLCDYFIRKARVTSPRYTQTRKKTGLSVVTAERGRERERREDGEEGIGGWIGWVAVIREKSVQERRNF